MSTTTPNKRRRRRRWPYVAGILAALAALVVVAGSRGGGAPKLDTSLMTEVKRGDLAIDVLETGKVRPREKVEIKSKVAGQVEAVLVEEGAQVKTGQLLLRLDTTDYRREVARAAADVAQAQNALEFAQLKLERAKRGLEARGVAQADLDLAANEVKAKQAALLIVNVALSAAEDRLRYTQLLSPMNGTVIERGIQPGEVVTPGVQATFEGKPLLTIGDLSTLIVGIELNQIDVAKVKLGHAVTVALDALPGRTYEAKVTKVAPAATLPKGKEVEIFAVEATLSAPDEAIKPGMTADVRIHVDKRTNVLTLPIEAVVTEKGNSYVSRLVKATGKASGTAKVQVTLGARNDRDVEILSGVEANDQVLVQPGSASANEYKM
jgi:membrane fusion protein, macrolide-specific efflux system